LLSVVAKADLYLVSKGNKTWVEVTSLSDLTLTTNQVVTLRMLRISDVPSDPDDPDDPDPPGDTLQSRTEQRARLIDEPDIAKVLGLIWGQWAKAMRESGTAYTTAVSGVDALLPTLLRGSQKADQWGTLHATTKGELANEPKTAATLDKVAAGYSAAGGASQINFGKLIECILCFIEAWSSATEGKTAQIEPVPDPVMQVIDARFDKLFSRVAK
jgi:hypothetical protein